MGSGGGVGRIGTLTGPDVIGPGSAADVPVAVRLNDVAVSLAATEATTLVPSADGARVTSGSSTVHVITMLAPAGSAALLGTKPLDECSTSSDGDSGDHGRVASEFRFGLQDRQAGGQRGVWYQTLQYSENLFEDARDPVELGVFVAGDSTEHVSPSQGPPRTHRSGACQ